MSKPSRMEILELLSNGKITAAEAANLLSDIGEPAAAEKAPPLPAAEKAPAAPLKGAGSYFFGSYLILVNRKVPLAYLSCMPTPTPSSVIFTLL